MKGVKHFRGRLFGLGLQKASGRKSYEQSIPDSRHLVDDLEVSLG